MREVLRIKYSLYLKDIKSKTFTVFFKIIGKNKNMIYRIFNSLFIYEYSYIIVVVKFLFYMWIYYIIVYHYLFKYIVDYYLLILNTTGYHSICIKSKTDDS
jgi:hypothetical protein